MNSSAFSSDIGHPVILSSFKFFKCPILFKSANDDIAFPSRDKTSNYGKSGKSFKFATLLPLRISFFKKGRLLNPLNDTKLSFSVMLNSSRLVRFFIPSQLTSLFLFKLKTFKDELDIISQLLISFSSKINLDKFYTEIFGKIVILFPDKSTFWIKGKYAESVKKSNEDIWF